jgi:hydrogenase expression/formation protein HypD
VLQDPDCAVSGFILPGHVSTIIGTGPYAFLADEFCVPGVVAGFELVDVLVGIESLIELLQGGTPAVKNEYTRVVRDEGNPTAWAAVERVFEIADVAWRGIGVIPESGLAVREEFTAFDAARRFGVALEDYELPEGCACGQVLRGRMRPAACPLFGTKCAPRSPVGPCMVSVEGACAVSYKYGED